jgi:hypothetical protein
MFGQHRHVQLHQELQILDDSAGPLAGNNAVKTVTADIRSLVEAFVEELHWMPHLPAAGRTSQTPGTSDEKLKMAPGRW